MERLGFITIPEAARRTSASRSVIYAAITAGRLTIRKVGPRLYIDVRSLVEMLGPEAGDLVEASGADRG
jgi:excisionase family DNA binding protein